MCFVIDDNSLGYYLIFIVPIVLYVLYFLYTYCRYMRPVLKRHQLIQAASGSGSLDNQSLISKDTTVGGLNPSLHNKLYINIKL
jgi:hypothetical protein